MVRLLSSPLVLSSSSVYAFQTGSNAVDGFSAAPHGLGLDCGSGLEKQLGGDWISGRQCVGQRMDRISKMGQLGATESICIYDLCQNLDRIENMGSRRGGRGPHGLFGQDANLGRHGHGFCTPLNRSQSDRPRGPVRLPPSTLYKSDQPVSGANHTSMPAARRRRRTTRRSKRRRKQQHGGVLPLLALIAPAIVAAGKAAALGALGGAAGYAAKRGLAAATCRRR